MKTYAKVEWSPEDVLTVRPNMSIEEAAEFLENNQRHIQNATVEYGWEVIKELLSLEGK